MILLAGLLCPPGSATAGVEARPDPRMPAQADSADTLHSSTASKRRKLHRPETEKKKASEAAATAGTVKAKKKPVTVKEPSSASNPAIVFSGVAELQTIYDDNILRASASTILEFREGISPWKFKIRTYDDMILSPKITLNFGRRVFGPRLSQLRVSYVLYQYVRNSIKNNSTWTFRLRQQTLGRDFLEFSYGYSPYAYIRELSDRAPTDPASSPLVWSAFKSTRSGFALGYSRRVGNRLNVRLDGGRVLRFYNQRFIENDNWEWNWTGQVTYSLLSAFRLNGQYSYSHVKARATDMVGQTVASSPTGDPSYDRDLYELTTDWIARGRLWRTDVIELIGQYQAYYYTSRHLYWDDPFHVGRKDQVYVIELNVTTTPVIGKAALEAGYRFSQRSSSATGQVDIGDEKDYKGSRIWVGANYPF